MKWRSSSPNGKLSCSEYFTERAITIKAIHHHYQKTEIVTCLPDHYKDIIQNARRVQIIYNIVEFELLLQRKDLKDSYIRPRRIHRPSSRPQLSSRLNFWDQESEPPPQFHFWPLPAQHNNSGPLQNHQTFRSPYGLQKTIWRNSPDSYLLVTQATHIHQKPNHGSNTNLWRENHQNLPRITGPRNNNYPSPEQMNVCHTITERIRKQDWSKPSSSTVVTQQENCWAQIMSPQPWDCKKHHHH